jgi:alpha-acetolactate decarboxylase
MSAETQPGQETRRDMLPGIESGCWIEIGDKFAGTRMRMICLLLIPMALGTGCTASRTPESRPDSGGWNGKVQQWGTLRDVMHGTILDGQVRLSEVTNKPHIFGIGAPDKLQGEILIEDSVAWVAKLATGHRIETRRSDSPTDSAVFLAVAQVPRWTEIMVDGDVSAEEFDDFIQNMLQPSGLDKLDAVPFVIKGKFPSLKLHVLNGQCPFAEVKTPVAGSGPPHRITLNDVRGVLVGFYSEKGTGRITHHGTRTHVHALVGTGDERMVGHVDEGALKAGTLIRIPVYSSVSD